jgi:hypothetical protein
VKEKRSHVNRVVGDFGCDGKDGVEQVLVDIIYCFLYFSGISGAH